MSFPITPVNAGKSIKFVEVYDHKEAKGKTNYLDSELCYQKNSFPVTLNLRCNSNHLTFFE